VDEESTEGEGEGAAPLRRDDPDMPIPDALVVDGKPQTVLGFLRDALEERDRQKRWIDEAELRERMLFGQQWLVSNDPLVERTLATLNKGEVLPQENLMYPLAQTWSARVNVGRVSPRAYPFQPTPIDTGAARGCNKLLAFHRQRFNEDVMIAEAAMMAQAHGDVLFYATWDVADGPHLVKVPRVDPNGPMLDIATGQAITEQKWTYGGAVEEWITAPDYWTSGEDRYRKAKWLVVRRVVDRFTAQEQLNRAGFPDVRPKVDDYPTAMDTARRGVMTYELWHKPGARMRNGLFAIVIQNVVVKSTPWPLKNRTKLPGAVWKLGQINGSPRGKTHVAEAIHQQLIVNRTLRSIVMRVEAAESATQWAPSTVVDQLKRGGLKAASTDGVEKPRENVFWTEGPEVPGSLFQAYAQARQALRDVFGISEATSTGGDPTQTSSGAQLKTATALDDQKIAPARRALEQARLDVARDILELWQVNGSPEMLVRVIGADGTVDADFVRTADIDGADVQLEVVSGLYQTHLAGQVEAEQAAAGGFISPQQAQERRETGLGANVDEATAYARIDAQVRAAIAGQPQQPLPDVDAKLAAERVGVAIMGAQAAGLDGPQIKGAQQLRAAYQQLAAQQAQAAAQHDQQGGDATADGRNGPGKQAPSGARQAAVKPTKIREQQLAPGAP
jgi:hypothetical protein